MAWDDFTSRRVDGGFIDQEKWGLEFRRIVLCAYKAEKHMTICQK
jgi:hypothetical protein